MSERSDKFITEAARAEHQRLENWVVRAARTWRQEKGSPLSLAMLKNSVDALISFEERYKERLNG